MALQELAQAHVLKLVAVIPMKIESLIFSSDPLALFSFGPIFSLWPFGHRISFDLKL